MALVTRMIQTKWCVLTGAPGAGKTTVLERFRSRGFTCNAEVARIHIEQELAKGRTLDEIRAKEDEFQRALVLTKVQMEERSAPSAVILWDRGLPDSISYFRMAGLDPSELLPACRIRRYALVFVFDLLSLDRDNARTEDDETRRLLDTWLEADYRDLDYDVIRVPEMSIERREEVLMDHFRDL